MREIDQEALIMLTFSRSARKYIDIKNKLKSKTAINHLVLYRLKLSIKKENTTIHAINMQ